MKRVLFGALWALGSILFATDGANAHTYASVCTGTAGELEARISGTSAWTTTDGGAGTTAKIASGDIVRINSTCAGDIFATSGVTFEKTRRSSATAIHPCFFL